MFLAATAVSAGGCSDSTADPQGDDFVSDNPFGGGGGGDDGGDPSSGARPADIGSSEDITPMGSTAMQLPRPESLRAVRFDGDRGYAITFEQTDPLFTLDLTDPAAPRQVGELEIPGWVTHNGTAGRPHSRAWLRYGRSRRSPCAARLPHAARPGARWSTATASSR